MDKLTIKDRSSFVNPSFGLSKPRRSLLPRLGDVSSRDVGASRVWREGPPHHRVWPPNYMVHRVPSERGSWGHGYERHKARHGDISKNPAGCVSPVQVFAAGSRSARNLPRCPSIIIVRASWRTDSFPASANSDQKNYNFSSRRLEQTFERWRCF